MGKYTLFKQNVEFEECNERFFDIQYRVWNAMDSASSEFSQWYDSCGDILTVLKGYEKKAAELVIRYANEPLFNELPDLGIYDISQDSYDEECFVIDNFGDALEQIADAYNSIIAQQEAEEEYRAERKACRGRVVGGGFGVGGALKGMAAAGAMNAISGAGHSLVNAIGNATSAIEAASAKRVLYNNATAKELLKDGIRSDVLASFNAHMNLINSRKSGYYIGNFDSDKAGALFENAKKVPDKCIELLIESFKNCPWDEELLVYIFTTYKEERKNMWEISNRFHVDLSSTAENIFSKLYTGEAANSEEKAQAVKADIQEQMQLLGIQTSKTIDRIEEDGLVRILGNYSKVTSETEKQKIFDAVKSYDATDKNKAKVIHATRVWELAQLYNVHFTTEEVESIFQKVYTANKDDSNFIENAQLDKQKIKTIMAALSVTESSVYNQLETDCLACVCYNFQNADEVTCNDLIKKVQDFDALEKNKKPFLHKLQLRIEAIWSAEDGEIFDNVFLNTNIHEQEEINKAIAFIKEKKRTSSANIYINALAGCSEENIKKAHQFQQPATKLAFFGGVVFVGLGVILLFVGLGFLWSLLIAAIGAALLFYHNSLKRVWNLLTINGTLVHSMLSVTGHAQRNSVAKSDAEIAAELEKEAQFRMAIEDVANKNKEN